MILQDATLSVFLFVCLWLPRILLFFPFFSIFLIDSREDWFAYCRSVCIMVFLIYIWLLHCLNNMNFIYKYNIFLCLLLLLGYLGCLFIASWRTFLLTIWLTVNFLVSSLAARIYNVGSVFAFFVDHSWYLKIFFILAFIIYAYSVKTFIIFNFFWLDIF